MPVLRYCANFALPRKLTDTAATETPFQVCDCKLGVTADKEERIREDNDQICKDGGNFIK